MIKLYKTEAGKILYWEAWEADGGVTKHWGTIGTRGKTKRLRIPTGESGENTIDRESQEARKKGFEEIPFEDHSELIVQYRLAGWGSPEDLEKRHSIENILNESLGWTGNGHCDGGDIGSGSINAFCYVVDAAEATKAIVSSLKENGLIEGAVIAIDEEDDYRVAWPSDFEGDFSVL